MAFLPLPLGEGWGEGVSASSFAPSPHPSQREGKADIPAQSNFGNNIFDTASLQSVSFQ